MSEYQYYEFLAIDRPLDTEQQAEVRALSTRARITATSFVNEYHWGDFRGDPVELVEHYYDAHLYTANWGTRRIMFRVPHTLLDSDVVGQYCVDEHIHAWISDDSLVIDLLSDDEPDDDFEHPEGSLSAIVGVRAELAAGDLRPLYLAWLAAHGVWERDESAFDGAVDDEPEPPVPAGLGSLTAPQRALADFLRLDDDLLSTAARLSFSYEDTADDSEQLTTWVLDQQPAEKDRLLTRLVHDQTGTVRMELLRRFREDTAPARTEPEPQRRTVGELLDEAASRRTRRARHQTTEQVEQEVPKIP